MQYKVELRLTRLDGSYTILTRTYTANSHKEAARIAKSRCSRSMCLLSTQPIKPFKKETEGVSA